MAAPRAPENAPKKERFEDYLAQVEQAVQALEGGTLPLEDSLAQYESGIKALKRCHEILDAAEKRVQILLKTPDGGAQAEPLEIRKSDDVEREERARRRTGPGPGAPPGGASGGSGGPGADELPF